MDRVGVRRKKLRRDPRGCLTRRVALACGRTDWEAWADEQEPGVLAELEALAWLDGWGDDWQRTALLCSTIHNAITRLRADLVAFTGVRISKDDWAKADEFLPSKLRPPKPKQAPACGESLDAWMRRAAGVS